jgi:HAD superfamily hydrolase (TIGR01509 family)
MTTRAIILDVDGTLVDSNHAHTYAWIDALAEAGYKAHFDDILRMIGMGGDKLLPRATGGLDSESPEGQEITRRRGEIFKERYLPPLRPTPGAEELLARLKRDRLARIVASSAQRNELKGLLRIVHADDLLPEAASGDDAERSKPHPDIVHAALERAGVRSDEAVMIGDTPYDIEAAHGAGVCIIAVRCGGWDDVGLRGADAIFDSPADLLIHYAHSPIAPLLHVVV